MAGYNSGRKIYFFSPYLTGEFGIWWNDKRNIKKRVGVNRSFSILEKSTKEGTLLHLFRNDIVEFNFNKEERILK